MISLKILLLNPPTIKEKIVRIERCMQKASAWSALWPPLPLMYCQSILDNNNHETKLIDAVAKEWSFEKTSKFIKNYNPDLIVLNTSAPTIEEDKNMAKFVKNNLPKCKVVGIGVMCTLLPEIFDDNFDYVIDGEVELAIIDVINYIKQNYRRKFIRHEVPDLNELPFPAMYDLELDKYKFPFTKERFMLVNSARGCPFNCSFCIVPTIYKRKVKYRDPKKIVDEIERNLIEYNIKNFLFWTENFTFNEDFASDVCLEILRRNIKVKFMATSRVDTVTPKLLKLMKRAGCWLISFGIECMNQKVLNSMNKQTNLRQIELAIKWAKQVKLDVVAHIIIGLPDQTKESVKETVDWLIKKDIDYCQFYCAIPYWKTELRKIAEKNKWIETDRIEDYDMSIAIMRNEHMTTDEIQELRTRSYRKFYFRPRFILKEIHKNRFKPTYLLRIICDGIYFLKDWVKIE